MLLCKTKKIFIIVLCTAIAFLAFSLSMSASDDSIGKNVGGDTISTRSAPDIVSADAITQIDLSDCYTELYDIDGNIVSTSRDALTADTIPSGYTMRYYRADESAFAIKKNQQISIEKINGSLRNVAAVVEANAASAEENTAISQELNSCSQTLMDMANSFRLRDE